MHSRTSLGLGILIGGLVLAVSCSGPSPDAAEEPDGADRSRRYHVRLDVTERKEAANQTLGRALEWWGDHSETVSARPLASGDDSPVAVVWRAPLYRIQIGPFPSRAQADSVLEIARSAFPDAFVSPARARPDRPK